MRGNAQFILKVTLNLQPGFQTKPLGKLEIFFFVVVVDVFMRQTLTDDFFLEGVGYTKI